LNVLWNGYYFDSETDNYYLRNRYYSPDERRFLTDDPHGIIPDENWNNPWDITSQYTDGVGLQVYAGFNPISKRDEWGLSIDLIQNPWVSPIDRACNKGNFIQRLMCRLTYRCLMRENNKIAACQMAQTACNADCAVMYNDDIKKQERCLMYCIKGYVKCVK
jgi:RHS repeat-associated protein